jgi:sensor histidine kinase YesM
MKKKHVFIIHLLFWITIVIIPYFFFTFGPFRWSPENVYFLLQHIFNVIVFYLVYFVLIPFVLHRKSIRQMVWYSISFILVMSFIKFILNPFVKDYLGAFQKFQLDIFRQILYPTFWTVMYSFYSVIIYLAIEWYKERRIRYELIKEKQQGEIDLLKSQVNPHFLMNTLNNLYSLVYQGSKQSGEAILKLSDLMRYMLYDTHSDRVSLENEIKYLNSFIELQMLRSSNKDLVDFQISGDPRGKLIAPMLLIPFVENAFKHGNKNLPGMGITIRLGIDQKDIIFEVENIKASKSVQKISESGIGLQNIQKRLELQYPGKHNLEITDAIDHFYIQLKLTL